jgi:hypothetical protein
LNLQMVCRYRPPGARLNLWTGRFGKTYFQFKV